eukprot:1635410-Amphidinium_carterae.1
MPSAHLLATSPWCECAGSSTRRPLSAAKKAVAEHLMRSLRTVLALVRRHLWRAEGANPVTCSPHRCAIMDPHLSKILTSAPLLRRLAMREQRARTFWSLRCLTPILRRPFEVAWHPKFLCWLTSVYSFSCHAALNRSANSLRDAIHTVLAGASGKA